jgi:predicted MFS family arabinose efflux permease
VLLAARILTGAFGGILSAMVFAVVGDAIPIERRGAAMGWVTAAFSAASVFGVPFGLFLASKISWHAPFVFLACLGLPVWVMAWRCIPNTSQAENARENPLQLLQRVSHDRNQQWALLLIVLMMLGQFSVIPFLSPSMVANVGFTEGSLAYIYLLGGFTTLFTGPWIGSLADRHGRLRVLSTFLLLSIVPTIWITHLGPSPMLMVLVLTTSFFVVSGGRMIPVMAMMTAAVAPRYRGSFMSLQSAVQQIAAGVASLLAGWILVENPQGQLLNYPIVGYLAAVTSILALLIASRIKVVDSVAPQVPKADLQPVQV